VLAARRFGKVAVDQAENGAVAVGRECDLDGARARRHGLVALLEAASEDDAGVRHDLAALAANGAARVTTTR
jgi:hypothetical protein